MFAKNTLIKREGDGRVCILYPFLKQMDNSKAKVPCNSCLLTLIEAKRISFTFTNDAGRTSLINSWLEMASPRISGHRVVPY